MSAVCVCKYEVFLLNTLASVAAVASAKQKKIDLLLTILTIICCFSVQMSIRPSLIIYSTLNALIEIWYTVP